MLGAGLVGDGVARGRELVAAAQDALARGLLGYAVVVARRPPPVTGRHGVSRTAGLATCLAGAGAAYVLAIRGDGRGVARRHLR